VRGDFHSGVRGGVVTTPALFELSDGEARRVVGDALAGRAARG
jgi:hypothetical protein